MRFAINNNDAGREAVQGHRVRALDLCVQIERDPSLLVFQRQICAATVWDFSGLRVPGILTHLVPETPSDVVLAGTESSLRLLLLGNDGGRGRGDGGMLKRHEATFCSRLGIRKRKWHVLSRPQQQKSPLRGGPYSRGEQSGNRGRIGGRATQEHGGTARA
jgi:hypothetical protein